MPALTMRFQVYDHVQTLGMEVKLVWPAPWGIGKVLFFVTKYMAFVDVVLNMYC